MQLKFNAPVTFSLTLLVIVMRLIEEYLAPGLLTAFLTAPGRDFDPSNIGHYTGVLLYVLAHENWSHLWGNFLLILLLGPILEEKYDPKSFLFMLVATALIAGVFNILLRQPPLIGASSLAFMMILLVSFARTKPGDIPISLILVFLIYMINELALATQGTGANGSLAHIVGGVCGVIFGFMRVGQGPAGASAAPPAA